MKSKPWIVTHDGTGKRSNAMMLECRRCGAIRRFATPIALDVWTAAAKQFERHHSTCLPAHVASVSDLFRRPGPRP